MVFVANGAWCRPNCRTEWFLNHNNGTYKICIAVYRTVEESVAQLRQVVFDARKRQSLERAGAQYVRAHYSKEEFEKVVTVKSVDSVVLAV